jgi:acetolactate synthase-1/3 small subunit
MEPDTTVSREMALFKVNATVENRAELMEFAQIFRAQIIDVTRRTMTVEVDGTADKIDAFERMVRPHGLIEMARTGEVAIARSRPES